MITECPKSFVGYSCNPQTGEFVVKVCPSCPDASRAREEFKPFSIIHVPCREHYQKEIARRYP